MTPDYSPRITISLDNVLHNLQQIKRKIPASMHVMAVVKDDAYGCGALPIARVLEQEGDVAHFAVARTSEARALRKSGIKGSILVLGKATEEELRWGNSERICFVCNDIDDLVRWSALQIPIQYHLNCDTGMSRLGILPEHAEQVAQQTSSAQHLTMVGIFTHMASADVPNTQTVARQQQLFRSVVAHLQRAGITPHQIHYANSATLIRFPLDGCTMVRPGIALYGCQPDPKQQFEHELKPVVSFCGSVVSLRTLPAGCAVSYGGNYITKRATIIATISMGYAQGVPRYLSSRGEMLIGGKRYPIAGNVTMDYCMLDLGSASTVKIGDEAVCLGSQGSETISADAVALVGETIGYEVLCNLGRAVDRVYIRKGIEVHREPVQHV